MRLTSHFPKGLDPVHSVARLRLASSLTGQASSDEGAFRRFHVNIAGAIRVGHAG